MVLEHSELLKLYGSVLSIKDLTETIRQVTGYKGEIVFDSKKPDSSMRKLMDSSKLTRREWQPKIDLAQGLRTAYAEFAHNTINIHSIVGLQK